MSIHSLLEMYRWMNCRARNSLYSHARIKRQEIRCSNGRSGISQSPNSPLRMMAECSPLFPLWVVFSCVVLKWIQLQDGYLRIFNYTQMELHSVMKSYFGALNTLAWSPDGKLIATGGEDDLLTVYNVHEKRVVCRGHGHKSWISHVGLCSAILNALWVNEWLQVAFDPFCTVTEQDMAATNGSSAADESTLQAMSSIGVSDVNDVILREQKPSSSAKGRIWRFPPLHRW